MNEQEAKAKADKIHSKKDRIILKCKTTETEYRISFITYVKEINGNHYVELHLVPNGVTCYRNSIPHYKVRELFEFIIAPKNRNG